MKKKIEIDPSKSSIVKTNDIGIWDPVFIKVLLIFYLFFRFYILLI